MSDNSNDCNNNSNNNNSYYNSIIIIIIIVVALWFTQAYVWAVVDWYIQSLLLFDDNIYAWELLCCEYNNNNSCSMIHVYINAWE